MGSAPVKITNLSELGALLAEHTLALQSLTNTVAEIPVEVRRLHDLFACIDNTSEEADKVEIPLTIRGLIGTGLELEERIPFVRRIEKFMFELGYRWTWARIKSNTIESDQAVTGWKAVQLVTFHPGREYEFNVKIHRNSQINFNTRRPNPFQVFAIALPEVTFALTSSMSEYFATSTRNGRLLDPEDFVPSFISALKDDNWLTNLPPEGGVFRITPGMDSVYIHISVHTQYDGPQGCVVTEIDSKTNTLTIGGY